MSYEKLLQLSLFAAILFFGACRSATNDTPEGLVIVNAPISGKVRRVLVSEETNVPAKAALIEIEVVLNAPDASINANRQLPPNVPDAQAESRNAEEDLQRASVELQRIEPLVASGNAPQAHLDAARAQYQHAQERLDQLRRQPPTTSPILKPQPQNSFSAAETPKANFVVVSAPVAGNVRVIGVRRGQIVKAGQSVATISTEIK